MKACQRSRSSAGFCGILSTKFLKGNKGNPCTPDGDKATIIALSANASEEDIQKSLSIGMNVHAAKPIDVNDLFDAMKDLALR